MKQLETMYAWTPGTDQIEVGPWPDRTGWRKRYTRSIGACSSKLHRMTPDERLAMLFIDFNTIVVRDGVSVAAAHAAFLKIDEYRRAISADTPGADVDPDESYF